MRGAALLRHLRRNGRSHSNASQSNASDGTALRPICSLFCPSALRVKKSGDSQYQQICSYFEKAATLVERTLNEAEFA